MAGRGPADHVVGRQAGTLLVAQSLGDVRGTVGRLTTLFAGIGGVAVLLIAGPGYLAVRTSLHPLDIVAALVTGHRGTIAVDTAPAPGRPVPGRAAHATVPAQFAGG